LKLALNPDPYRSKGPAPYVASPAQACAARHPDSPLTIAKGAPPALQKAHGENIGVLGPRFPLVFNLLAGLGFCTEQFRKRIIELLFFYLHSFQHLPNLSTA